MVILLIASVSIGIWYSFPVHLAKAAALAPLTTTYIDLNTDGTVDNIKLTFTNVTACTYEASDWTVAVAGTINVTAVTGFTNSASCTTDEYINVAVTTTSQITGGVTNPQIIYTNGGTLGSVVADANDGTATFTATDASKPVIKTITYKDADGDGKIDRMTLTYTETVTAASVLAANDLIFGDVGSFFGAAFGANNTDLISGSVASTDVNLGTEASIVATHDDSGTLAVSTQNVFSLTDGTNTNSTTGNQSQATYADGAGPVLIGGQYTDDDGDGDLNFLNVSWSEDVVVTGSTAVDWTITGGSVNAVYATSGDFPLAVTYPLVVTSDPNETGGAVDPTVSYDNDDLNGSVVDSYSNAAGTTGPVSVVDMASPIAVSAVYKDTNNNGTVDRIDITLSVDVGLTCSWDAGDWLIPTPGSITAASPSACGISGNDVQITISADANETGGMTDPTINYVNASPKNSVADGSMNSMQPFASPVTATDGAAPVFLTTSPADNATGVEMAANLVITFSEPMTTASVTGAIARVPSFTLGSAAWTVGDTVLTYASHDAWAGMQNYVITLAGTIASAAAGDGNLGAGPVANPFDFTTVGGSSGGGVSSMPDSVTVTAPSGGESWVGNSSHNITWSTTGATISKVKLLYSLDSGINFPHTIATNETNDGTYSWTVPNVANGTAKIKIEGYDSSSLLVTSDISDANFAITYVTPAPGTPETPGTPGTPSVPETPLNELQTGDLFKSPLSTSVYYYGSDGKRHVFPNEKTYKSWYVDFTGIKTISASQLQGLTLGKNVTVRPGTVLLKIQTDPKVYAVEPGGLLRWVPTEARIKILYGDDWATKIIDVPLAFWGDYSFGSDISTDTHPTGALVQYTGTTDKYYIQGAEKRKVTTAGFAVNNFRSEYVLAIPATLYYAPGVDITGAESALTSIY